MLREKGRVWGHRESGKAPGRGFAGGEREEEPEQEHKENSRGKKSPSQLSGDHKRAGPSTDHGCAVLTQRLWRQHLKQKLLWAE